MSADAPWFDHPLAIVDVETTGLDPENDRVIEIAVVHMCGAVVTDRYVSLVNPQRELPPEVVNITRITPEDLATAPTFDQVAHEVARRLEGRAFVAYNLPFDRGFVQAELRRCGLEWAPTASIDPLVFVRELHKNQGSKRLAATAARLGIELSNAHRADADAIAAGQVLYALRADLPELLADLELLQAQWAQQQDNEMAGWRKRRGGQAFDASPTAGLSPADRGNALGPAYIYSDDPDPVRAMFSHLPDSGSRR
ncbi:MAG: 3'-5' exonuclease [Deltaproteobacteria bacterium]|nr:3'-5' exonuclease [Deltaproteobacteria bacterium]MCB9786833.1 3'-5' exonuclease [Deltaproteobacteria bacterium]